MTNTLMVLHLVPAIAAVVFFVIIVWKACKDVSKSHAENIHKQKLEILKRDQGPPPTPKPIARP